LRISTALASLTLIATALTPARATSYFGAFSNPSGTLSTSQVYTSNGVNIVAYGFLEGSPNTPTDLYGKASGGDENGLGLKRDTTGDNEIQTNDFVQLDFSDPNTKLNITQAQMSIGSSTNGEGWAIYGSNTLGTLGTLLKTGSNENSFNILPYLGDTQGQYRYLSVTATKGNVLLDSVVLTGTAPTTCFATPEPATLLMVGLALTGCGITMRKRRLNAVR
jgi:hypothetical protein